jgi:hypothetical protein
MVADVLGRLAAAIEITPGNTSEPGNTSDITVAPGLLGTLEEVAVTGDKGYDTRALRETLRAQDCASEVN